MKAQLMDAVVAGGGMLGGGLAAAKVVPMLPVKTVQQAVLASGGLQIVTGIMLGRMGGMGAKLGLGMASGGVATLASLLLGRK